MEFVALVIYRIVSINNGFEQRSEGQIRLWKRIIIIMSLLGGKRGIYAPIEIIGVYFGMWPKLHTNQLS